MPPEVRWCCAVRRLCRRISDWLHGCGGHVVCLMFRCTRMERAEIWTDADGFLGRYVGTYYFRGSERDICVDRACHLCGKKSDWRLDSVVLVYKEMET